MAALGPRRGRGLPVPRPARPAPGARRRRAAAGAGRARRERATSSPPSAAGWRSCRVDPRLGRMVLEADSCGCVDEVLVIAAALSIQDPRERPADAASAGRPVRTRRFADESSDFLALLNLWRYLREQQRELSANQFRQRCQARVPALPAHARVAGPRRPAAPGRAKGLGVKLNHAPAEPDDVHRALLSGLLSHVGAPATPRRREYLGARSARFAICRRARRWPRAGRAGSMVGRAGGDLAAVGPHGRADRPASGSSRWPSTWSAAATASRAGTARAAPVVATERVTLYGLPIVAGRTVGYGRIDPRAVARAVHPPRARRGRVGRAPPLPGRPTGRWSRRSSALEDRARRRDILVDDEVALRLLRPRAIPADVVSGAHFDRWWRDERRRRTRAAELHARAAHQSGRGRICRKAARAPGARVT